MNFFEDVIRYVLMRVGVAFPNSTTHPDGNLFQLESGPIFDNSGNIDPSTSTIQSLIYAFKRGTDEVLEYYPRETLRVVERVSFTNTSLPVTQETAGHFYTYPTAFRDTTQYIDEDQITAVYPFPTVSQVVGRYGLILTSMLTVGWMWPHAEAFTAALMGFDTIDKTYRGVFTWRVIHEYTQDGNVIPRLMVSLQQPATPIFQQTPSNKMVVRHTVKVANLEPIDPIQEDFSKIFLFKQAEKEYIRSFVAREFLIYLRSIRGSFEVTHPFQDVRVSPSVQLLDAMIREETERLEKLKKKIQAMAYFYIPS